MSCVSFLAKMSRLQQLSEEARRNVIGEFYRIHWSKGKTYTVNHFQNMKVPKSTTYSVIQRCGQEISMKRKSGSGRPGLKVPEHKVRALKKFMVEKIGRSQARASAKFKVSQQYVSKILRTKTSLKYRQRKRFPVQLRLRS